MAASHPSPGTDPQPPTDPHYTDRIDELTRAWNAILRIFVTGKDGTPKEREELKLLMESMGKVLAHPYGAQALLEAQASAKQERIDELLSSMSASSDSWFGPTGQLVQLKERFAEASKEFEKRSASTTLRAGQVRRRTCRLQWAHVGIWSWMIITIGGSVWYAAYAGLCLFSNDTHWTRMSIVIGAVFIGALASLAVSWMTLSAIRHRLDHAEHVRWSLEGVDVLGQQILLEQDPDRKARLRLRIDRLMEQVFQPYRDPLRGERE